MASPIYRRRRPPSAQNNAFAAGTLQLVDQLRRNAPGQFTDNRYEQSNHYKGVIYVAIRALMDALLSSTIQVNRKHRRYAQVSLRKLEKSLEVFRSHNPELCAVLEKAMPTPHANSEDEQFRPFDDPDHSLVKLIDQPNRTETFNELLSQLVLQYNLTGSGLLWANPNSLGVPGELYVLPTALCYPQPATPEYPEGWWRVTQYYPSGGYGLLPSPIAGGGAPVDGRDIFQFKNPHPLWRWDAYSPLTAGSVQLDILESIDQARWTAMDMGLTPDMVLLAPGVQQPQLDAYLERLKQTNIGKRNHRKVMAIGGDQGDSRFDVKFPSIAAKDMDFSGGWDQMTAFALALFGVPKSVAGLATTGSYAELYAALKQFHTLTLRPLVARLGVWLTKHLARIWGKDLAIQIDLPTIDDQQLQEQQLSTDLAHDGLTYNEYRALRGRKPVPGGDVLCSVYVATKQAEAQQEERAAFARPAPPGPPATPETSSPNGSSASPQAGEQPPPTGASDQGDELSSLLGTPTPGGDDQHVQNSVADAALASLGVSPQQSPIGTQTKSHDAQFEKGRRSLGPGMSFGRTSDFAKPGKRAPSTAGQPANPGSPVSKPVASPAGSATPTPATSDINTKAGESNREPGEVYPSPTTGAPRQQTASDTSAPAPKPTPTPNPYAPTKPGTVTGQKQSPPPDPTTPRVPVNPQTGRAIATPVQPPQPVSPPAAKSDNALIPNQVVPRASVVKPGAFEVIHDAAGQPARETSAHDTKKPGEFAPKTSSPNATAPAPTEPGAKPPFPRSAPVPATVPAGTQPPLTPPSAPEPAVKPPWPRTVQPIAPAPELAAAVKAGQLPHADSFKPAAQSIVVDTPAARQSLTNVASWAGNHAEQHADAVAQHFGIDRIQAFRLLTHAMTAIAQHAANRVNQTGSGESANINATLTHTPTGQSVGIKFHPRTIAAREAVNNLGAHLRGGHELTPEQASEYAANLDHLPPDEVERESRANQQAVSVAEQRRLNRIIKHAQDAAPEQEALGEENPAQAPTGSEPGTSSPNGTPAPQEQPGTVPQQEASSPTKELRSQFVGELQTPSSRPNAASRPSLDVDAATPAPSTAELESGKLGAHIHPNVQIRNVNGKDWVVKGRNGQRKSVENEAVASQLARSIGLDVPQVHHAKLNGQDQAVVEHVPGTPLTNLDAQQRREALSKVPKEEIDKHALFDYLIGSSDPNNGNYLLSPNGKLTAIDKEKSLRNGDVGDRTHYHIPFFLADAAPLGTSAADYQFQPESVAHMADMGDELAAHLKEMGRNADARGVERRTAVLKQLAQSEKPISAGELNNAGYAHDKSSPPPGFFGRAREHLRNLLAPGNTEPSLKSIQDRVRKLSSVGESFTVNKDTGLVDSARVGVPAMHVPESADEIPQIPNLSKKQQKVQDRFRKAYGKNPDKLADDYLKALRKGKVGVAPNVFGTDDVKMLNKDWNPGETKPGDKLDPKTQKAMARYNTAVHQTANAVAKRAFLKYLDTLPPDKKSVLVLNGGVAGGKGSSLARANDPSSPYYGKIPAAEHVGAVWDAAGEQNATENEWILQECKKRGITPVFTYVYADPKTTWDAPDRGVIRRALRKGRMVDARLFADSYAEGAKNMHAFYEKHKNDGTKFIFLDNRQKGQPKVLPTFPKEALQWDAENIYHDAVKNLKENAGKLPKSLLKGGLAGTKIWGKPRPTNSPKPSSPG